MKYINERHTFQLKLNLDLDLGRKVRIRNPLTLNISAYNRLAIYNGKCKNSIYHSHYMYKYEVQTLFTMETIEWKEAAHNFTKKKFRPELSRERK